MAWLKRIWNVCLVFFYAGLSLVLLVLMILGLYQDKGEKF